MHSKFARPACLAAGKRTPFYSSDGKLSGSHPSDSHTHVTACFAQDRIKAGEKTFMQASR